MYELQMKAIAQGNAEVAVLGSIGVLRFVYLSQPEIVASIKRNVFVLIR